MGIFTARDAVRSSETAGRKGGRKLIGGALASALVAVGSLAAVSIAGTAATAGAATEGNGPNGSFYDVPSVPAGTSHGTLLYYNTTSSSEISGATGYLIAYASEDDASSPVVVTGTLWVPTAAWTGSGPRPLITFDVGTQGLGQNCAPSKQLAQGTEYDAVGISKAVAAGYAVVVTDYQWLGTTDTSFATYMVGLDAAHDTLDAVNAAEEVPGAGLSTSAPVVIWGYSEGGQASIGAAELWKSYDPSIDVVGDAAGGVPGDLIAVGNALNGGLGAAFLFDVIVGYHSAYPSLPYSSLINATGTSAIKTLETNGMTVELLDNLFKNIDSYTTGSLTLAQVEAQGNWIPTIEANSVGQTSNSDFPVSIPVPVFNYRADVDEIIPTTVEDQVYANLCSVGDTVQAGTYPGDHLLTDYEAVGDALTFIKNVTTGKSVFDSCNISKTSLYQAVNL